MDNKRLSNHALFREFPGGNLLSSEDTYLTDKGSQTMSSINGTYVNSNAGAKLVITDGNDSNGTFTFTIDKVMCAGSYAWHGIAGRSDTGSHGDHELFWKRIIYCKRM